MKKFILGFVLFQILLNINIYSQAANTNAVIDESINIPFVPIEGANNPMGVPLGIMPGRVAWVYDPDATSWDESRGSWWDEYANDQGRIDKMFSKTVLSITNQSKEDAAWKALFINFNEERGNKNTGYSKGEKIAIKINQNNDRNSYDDTPWINTSPHVVCAVLRGLVIDAGVNQENITVFDASRYFTPHFYNYVTKLFPKVKMVDGYGGMPGRIKSTFTPDRITYAVQTQMGSGVASCAVEANYLINIYIAKGHPSSGVTLSGKNHYGTVDGRDHKYINVKTVGYDQYNPIVELMGHKDLGAKTILNVCDMLYGCYHSDAAPIKWKMPPFNNNWPSSLVVSQDQVANDSVVLDFLTSEFTPRLDIPVGVNGKGKKVSMAKCDALFHEAAQANNPPSGTVYAPNGDGIRLKSLGVHEHWNNPVDKKYSRNLGLDNGIELIYIKQSNN